jgi:predicted PurR-regulated permease PerM
LATVWAVFSFATNYIPNIGFVIGLVPPVVMALLANGPMTALWVVIGYIIFNTVIQTVIQPRVTGQAVGITATVAVLSLLLWSYVLGGLGAILAIPATLLLKTLFIDIDPKARWVNTLIAADPGTSEQDPMKLSELLDRDKRLRLGKATTKDSQSTDQPSS